VINPQENASVDLVTEIEDVTNVKLAILIWRYIMEERLLGSAKSAFVPAPWL